MVSAKDKNEFVQKLTRLLTDYSGFQEPRRKLSAAMGQFARENLIDRYDEELEKPAPGTICPSELQFKGNSLKFM